MSFSDVYSTVMKARRVIALIGIVAGAGYKAVPMVWHKAETKPVAAAAKANNGVTTTNANGVMVKGPIYSFGEVTLTNHYETCVKIGEGKNCLLVPKMLGNHTLELTLSVESRTAEGRTRDLSVKQISAKAGKPVEVALGGVQLSFTPKLFTE